MMFIHQQQVYFIQIYMTTKALDKQCSFFKDFLINNQQNNSPLNTKQHSLHNITPNSSNIPLIPIFKRNRQLQQHNQSKIQNFYLFNKQYVIDKKANKKFLSLLDEYPRSSKTRCHIILRRKKQRTLFVPQKTLSNVKTFTNCMLHFQGELNSQDSHGISQIHYNKVTQKMSERSKVSSLSLRINAYKSQKKHKKINKAEDITLTEYYSSKALTLSHDKASKTPQQQSSKYVYLNNKFYNKKPIFNNKLAIDKLGSYWQNRQKKKLEIEQTQNKCTPKELQICRPYFIRESITADKLLRLKRNKEQQLSLTGFNPLFFKKGQKKGHMNVEAKPFVINIKKKQTRQTRQTNQANKKSRVQKRMKGGRIQRCKTELISHPPTTGLDISQQLKPWQTIHQPLQHTFY